MTPVKAWGSLRCGALNPFRPSFFQQLLHLFSNFILLSSSRCLGPVSVRPQCQARSHILSQTGIRQHDYCQAREPLRVQPLKHVEAVLSRHLQIQENQVRNRMFPSIRVLVLTSKITDGLLSILRLAHDFKTRETVDDTAQEISIFLRIIRDQHFICSGKASRHTAAI